MKLYSIKSLFILSFISYVPLAWSLRPEIPTMEYEEVLCSSPSDSSSVTSESDEEDMNTSSAFRRESEAVRNEELAERFYENGQKWAREENWELAQHHWQLSSHFGYAPAQHALGCLYRDQYPEGPNWYKAFEHFKKAAENVYYQAFLDIGFCYEKGLGTAVNKDRAFLYYTRAYDFNPCEAIEHIALMQWGNRANAETRAQIWTYVNELLEHSSRIGLYLRGRLMLEYEEENMREEHRNSEHTVPENFYDRALECLFTAAEEGCGQAHQTLGVFYRDGTFLPQDMERAVYHLEQAMSFNAPKAFVLYGDLIETADPEQACTLYNRAAFLGEKKGIFALARCYEQGIYVRQDRRFAFDLYHEAANKGSKKALFILGYWYEKGLPGLIEPNIDLALSYFERLAEYNDSAALYSLACLYYEGERVPVDFERAYDYVQRSITAGETKGLLLQGIMLYEGQGVEKNAQHADIVLHQALEQAQAHDDWWAIATCYAYLGKLYANQDMPMSNMDAAQSYFDKASVSYPYTFVLCPLETED